MQSADDEETFYAGSRLQRLKRVAYRLARLRSVQVALLPTNRR